MQKIGKSKIFRYKKKQKNKKWVKKHTVIEDAEIMPKSLLKKRLKQPNNSIKLSGKKKRKILNQLRREMNENSKMEIVQSTSSKSVKKQQSKIQNSDVEMAEA